MKGIDHLVLCGRSLEAMREAYARLGFTLTPPAQHPFGTQNSLIQLDGLFLELLSLANREKIPEHGERQFSFAAFNRDFLDGREGFSMLVLDSVDARADVSRYRRLGLQTYEPFEFSRRAMLPGGEEATVGFSLAFVSSRDMPLCGFWQKKYQQHENGARTVVEVALVAAEPEKLAPFLEAFAEPRVVRGNELRLRTTRGDIAVYTPGNYERIYRSASPDLKLGPRFAGYTLGLQVGAGRAEILGSTVELFGTAVRFQPLPVAAESERH
jgi:glyoxalase-like protein